MVVVVCRSPADTVFILARSVGVSLKRPPVGRELRTVNISDADLIYAVAPVVVVLRVPVGVGLVHQKLAARRGERSIRENWWRMTGSVKFCTL